MNIMQDNALLTAQNLSFATYSHAEVENSPMYRQGNVYQKDWLLFMQMLEDTHPAFCEDAEETPFQIKKVRKEGYKWASGCQSEAALGMYMQAVLSRIHDAHTSVYIPTDNSLIYPFALFCDAERVYMRALDRANKSFLGKQVEFVNDRPVREVLAGFGELVSSDNGYAAMEKAGRMMQFHSYWQSHLVLRSDSLLKFTFSDSETLFLRPVPRQKLDIVWESAPTTSPTIRRNGRTPFLYKLMPEQSICYLQFNTCNDQSSVRYQLLASQQQITEAMESKLRQVPRFDEFLKEMFGAIEEYRIATLVVDMRDNTGGNSLLCDVLLSWLIPEEEMKRGRTQIRFSDLWEKQYPAMAAEYRQRFAAKQEEMDRKRLYDTASLSEEKPETGLFSMEQLVDMFFVKNRDKGRIFKGNVVFIQNERTFSSAGLLMVQAADNRIGTIVGTPATFRPCSYGDLLAWELPNTQVKGFVSHKRFCRPDMSKCQEESLIPDVLLSTSWEETIAKDDNVWKWIIEKYGKK